MPTAKGAVAITLGTKYAASIGRNFARLRKGFKSIGRVAAATFSKAFDISKYAAAATVGMGVGLGVLVKQATDVGDAFDKLSARTGLSVKFLAGLKFAAQIGGTELEIFEKSSRKLAKSALDASRGLQTYVREFDALGITIKDSTGELKNPEVLFLETGEALSQLTNATKKAAIASNLFGRSGTQLLPMLKKGKAGIVELMRESEALGNMWNKQTAAAAADLTDSWTRVWTISENMRDQFSVRLMPTIQKLTDRFGDWFKVNRQLIQSKLIAWGDRVATGIEWIGDKAFDTAKAFGKWVDTIDLEQWWECAKNMAQETYDIIKPIVTTLFSDIQNWTKDQSFQEWWETAKLSIMGVKVTILGLRDAVIGLTGGARLVSADVQRKLALRAGESAVARAKEMEVTARATAELGWKSYAENAKKVGVEMREEASASFKKASDLGQVAQHLREAMATGPTETREAMTAWSKQARKVADLRENLAITKREDLAKQRREPAEVSATAIVPKTPMRQPPIVAAPTQELPASLIGKAAGAGAGAAMVNEAPKIKQSAEKSTRDAMKNQNLNAIASTIY